MGPPFSCALSLSLFLLVSVLFFGLGSASCLSSRFQPCSRGAEGDAFAGVADGASAVGMDVGIFGVG
jgi:hypothetical protein